MINSSALLDNFYKNDEDLHSNRSSVAANAVFCVITNFLLKTAPSLVLTISCRRELSCNFLHDLVEHLFQEWDEIDKLIQIVVVPHNTTTWKRVPGVRNRNVMLVDSYQTFLDLDIISYTKKHNYNEYNYIILQLPDNRQMAHVQLILEYCWTHFLIHCSIQVQNGFGEVLIYTYFPYTEQHCGEVVPMIINRFNGSEFLETEFFPRKLDDFYNCTLRVATWHAPPYMVLSTEGNKARIKGGIDGKLVLEIADLLNFTIEVKIPPHQEQRGMISDNETSGALRMLIDGSADFSLGGFLVSAERNQLASYTSSYLQSKIAFYAVRSAYFLSSWEILIFPFELIAWLVLIFTLIVGIMGIFMANRCYKHCSAFFKNYNPENGYLDLFATFIGLPARFIPQASRARSVFVLWLFFSLVIRTVYQALLYHMIRTRIVNTMPQTISEVSDLNLTAVVDEACFNALGYIPGVLKILNTIVRNMTDEDFDDQYLVDGQSKKYLIVNISELMIFYVTEYEKPGMFEMLTKEIMAIQNAIYMPKHSFLIDQLNSELIWLRVTGFIEHWRRTEVDYQYYRQKVFDKEQIYGWKELYMIFVVYGIGLAIACLVFGLEVIASRCRVVRRVFQKML